jgi:hypothetical protein
MKQLTKEEQEQAVELIESIVSSTEKSSIYNRAAFIQSAKTFLQSLKPKVYIGCINPSYEIVFLEHKEDEYWCSVIEEAINFYSFDEARAALDSIEKDKDCKYFILTE